MYQFMMNKLKKQLSKSNLTIKVAINKGFIKFI